MTKSAQQSPPDLADLLQRAQRDSSLNLNCCQIGIIESFNPADQTATVQVAIKQIERIENDGTRILREFPLLIKCPVFHLYGGNSYITMPITAGDNCILLFNDREIDNWFLNGGVQAPTSLRAHDVSDAIALVGIRSLQNSIANYLTNGVRVQYDGGSKIDLTSDLIESIAALFLHNGDMEVTGDLTVNQNLAVLGVVEGNGGTLTFNANLVQTGAQEIHAGNGANGTFNVVTVVDGIVISGS